MKNTASPESGKPTELARVAVMKFFNQSQSQNYEWVEKSLPDAINNSMKARFEFIRQDEAKVNAVAARYLTNEGEYKLADADKIAKESQTDILIYGNFRLNETKDLLLLKAVIYNAQGKKVIGVVEESSPLDAKIFKAIDMLAQGIVEKIYAFALAAKREKGAENDLKILVLVLSFTSAEEERQAVAELELLKAELSSSYSGRYLTIYEFHQQYNVPREERQKSLDYAKKREREKLVAWLEAHGVRNALIVLVADKKVAITPIQQGKSAAAVTYSVNARPEEKKVGIGRVRKELSPQKEKVELTKDTLTNASVTLLHVSLMGGKGFLDAGNNLGMITGVSLQYGTQIWRPWLQPQVKLDGYYILRKEPVNYLIGGTLAAGLGYTLLIGNPLALTPYAMVGLFAGTVRNTVQAISFTLPVASAGLNFAWFFSPKNGLSLNLHSQYVIDSVAAGLFLTGSLGYVHRF
ncbi:MAG: hypothetical protein N2Z22_04610 [Turneriella sp.]|nr:hypothetical protein [Turneriella sp.]